MLKGNYNALEQVKVSNAPDNLCKLILRTTIEPVKEHIKLAGASL